MADQRRRWTRDELLVALDLYLRLPFGRARAGNPEIQEMAARINRTPDALTMKIANFASVDPTLNREGLRHAAEADREIWKELETNSSAVTNEIQQVLTRLSVEEIGAAAQGTEDVPLEEDELVLTAARREQSMFRAAVLSAYDFRCCVTGLSEPRLLVASHIVPWRDDPKNRLNPSNGLCLSAIHDRAFDRGLITFDDRFRLVLSPQMVERGDAFIGTAFTPFAGKQIALPSKFAPDLDLLAHHREHIFLASG